MNKQWVCSRCVRRLNIDGVGRRFRFFGESCPLCKDPGCGMVLVSTDVLPIPDKYEKCNYPGCNKMLKLPPWPISPGSIECLEHRFPIHPGPPKIFLAPEIRLYGKNMPLVQRQAFFSGLPKLPELHRRIRQQTKES